MSLPNLFHSCLAVGLVLLTASTAAIAQARYAATGPGSYIQVGVEASDFRIDYGQRSLGGAAVYLDANVYRRLGVEAEARTFWVHEDEGVHQTTYLVGPRISVLSHRIRPYAKLLAGRGKFYYPFQYATGSYFVVAPGAGLDWHIRKTPLMIRVIDVEIQSWPGFSFGPLKPYGISSGIALKIF